MSTVLLFNQSADNEFIYLVVIVIAILLSPAILFITIGLFLRKRKPRSAKLLFILSGVYLLIGLGYCGYMGI